MDEDCEGTDLCAPQRCVAGQCVSTPLVCDDSDACTEDRCDRRTGECVFDPLTIDGDGDGFRRPLPGFAPGSPGACGER